MERFFCLLAALEMLCVNMYTFHTCAKKKPSPLVIICVMGIFSALLFGTLNRFFGDTNLWGSGIFMICGIVYIVPLTFLYRHPVGYSISIACFSWIFTMLIYALSVQLADFFPQENYFASLLAIQTVLYALTILPFFRFVTGKFMYILKNADQKTQKRLFRLAISWFLFTDLLNYIFVFDTHIIGTKIAKILILCALAANALMTYQIFYSLRRENNAALEFENALRVDALTKLKNRMAFFEDAQALIDSHTPFTIFFIDLDNFKSVNDNYGHIKGDRYLRHFADCFSAGFSSYGTVYRISGDEFVFLYINGKLDDSVDYKIEHFEMCDCDEIPFKGFSIGRASYPEDAQTLTLLVASADKRMYKTKKVQSKRTGEKQSDSDKA